MNPERRNRIHVDKKFTDMDVIVNLIPVTVLATIFIVGILSAEKVSDPNKDEPVQRPVATATIEPPIATP